MSDMGLLGRLLQAASRPLKKAVTDGLPAHPVAWVTVLCLSVIAIPATLSLYPYLAGSLAGQLRQLKVKVEAPGASTIRVYWDDRIAFPESYTTFPVVDADVQQTWNVRMEA